jgi:ribosomal peptide maturation radical SAM protein 1
MRTEKSGGKAMTRERVGESILARSYSGTRAAPAEVILVNMPFTNLYTPSIGLGLLKGALKRVGVSSRVLNFQLRFAELLGEEAYALIEGRTYPEHLVGEWIFSESLFGRGGVKDLEDYILEVLSLNRVDIPEETVYPAPVLEELTRAIVKARACAEQFLEECLETIIAHGPKVTGFTSMFTQHVASLSLARRVKARLPDSFIVFGGSNCEGQMGAETFRQFDFIDLLVSGEGDQVFPEMVQSILCSEPVPQIQGIYNRRRPVPGMASQRPQNTPLMKNLDELPLPDYDDYFEELRGSSLALSKAPVLLFESSRGCWWGEKLHCTFCGLNGATMAYRSKSAERAFEELRHLTARYPGLQVNAVDNILDMKYFRTFLRLLAEGGRDFGLFYEVKSNLKKEQLALLCRAGVRTIQPGIESLNDNVLKLMRKGVTALQNIQFLKWCAELNLKAIYNIIWGFPGESREDYRKMIELIPIITHLRPPIGAGTIRIDRFSPNFNQHEELGFGGISPATAYRHVYPLGPEALFNLAYYFVSEKEQDSPAERFDTRGLSKEIRLWKEAHDESELFFMDKGSGLLIWDLRPCAPEPLVVLDDFSRTAYLACDEAMTLRQAAEFWRATSKTPPDEIRLKETLDWFVHRSLMIKEGEQYLALAYRKWAGVS